MPRTSAGCQTDYKRSAGLLTPNAPRFNTCVQITSRSHSHGPVVPARSGCRNRPRADASQTNSQRGLRNYRARGWRGTGPLRPPRRPQSHDACFSGRGRVGLSGDRTRLTLISQRALSQMRARFGMDRSFLQCPKVRHVAKSERANWTSSPKDGLRDRRVDAFGLIDGLRHV